MEHTEIRAYETSNYFEDVMEAYEYFQFVKNTNNPDDIIIALNNVIKYIGVAKISIETGLNRNSLYKTLSGKTKPKFHTIMNIISATEKFILELNESKKDSLKKKKSLV
ncbi:addiction module antidote protein [Flammeovirga sp. SJP92]|uniref:addiction module antidote protein n=1 Tax=Flammeovirga sp. SJP92 TaxID=1775430 RepID=UPI000787D9EB|nr:addiction module antidote protein [Flammeovirga sp. SJP92]KXX72746.1 hypothetical protein AVL50_32110 [Flammeovirga sp. SJP92]